MASVNSPFEEKIWDGEKLVRKDQRDRVDERWLSGTLKENIPTHKGFRMGFVK